jgi:hypothetical protein
MANIEENEKQTVFEQLLTVDMTDHTETKDTGKVKLSYLSWAWAWAEVKKRCPTIEYEIVKQDNGLPYVYDPNTGYMVFTRVQADGMIYPMWLPVMDSNNRAMKAEPYQVTFKNGSQITVQAATMMDINKAIMRCLVKNIAVATGLGLYIYAGEDLPFEEDSEEPEQEKPKKTTKKKQEAKPEPVATSEPEQEAKPETDARKEAYLNLINFCNENGLDVTNICNICNLTKESTQKDFEDAIEYAEAMISMTGGIG